MADVIATDPVRPGKGTGGRRMPGRGPGRCALAVDARMEGLTLEEYAKDHAELERALATWGVVHG